MSEMTDGLPPSRRPWAVLAQAIVISMAVLDGSIANIALPSIAADLHIQPSDSIWVVNAYQLAITVALLPFAALGDIYGYRRVYVWGAAVFTVGSLGCALSHSLSGLIIARVVQGIGEAGSARMGRASDLPDEPIASNCLMANRFKKREKMSHSPTGWQSCRAGE